MIDLHERFSLFALQKILQEYPRLANHLLREAQSATDLFQNRDRFKTSFGDLSSKWLEFKSFDDWRKIESEFSEISSAGDHVVCLSDPSYPEMLRMIYDPPLAITVGGSSLDILSLPAVGIVGSRKASESGRRLAFRIAEDLSDYGYCVVSGLAYGIDSAAHRGALGGDGPTIAVFGCGLDHIYPAAHRDLSLEIRRKGLLLSEFPRGSKPFPSHFPQRNRIISGLSLAVLVVEAAKSSGSLITAKTALEHGREVFAAPGTGGHWSVRGSNGLIRDGAVMVESADDMVSFLETERKKWPFLKKPGHLDCDMGKGSPLLSVFPSRGELSIDQLIAKSGDHAAKVLQELTRLVLDGSVEEISGRKFRLRRD